MIKKMKLVFNEEIEKLMRAGRVLEWGKRKRDGYNVKREIFG